MIVESPQAKQNERANSLATGWGERQCQNVQPVDEVILLASGPDYQQTQSFIPASFSIGSLCDFDCGQDMVW